MAKIRQTNTQQIHNRFPESLGNWQTSCKELCFSQSWQKLFSSNFYSFNRYLFNIFYVLGSILSSYTAVNNVLFLHEAYILMGKIRMEEEKEGITKQIAAEK